jgi:hypothetical protein
MPATETMGLPICAFWRRLTRLLSAKDFKDFNGIKLVQEK